MANPATTTTSPPDESRPEARCIRCGYDLRGHDVAGRCPECGLRAHWSLKAPVLLSQYPAHWVQSMSRGVKFLAAAYLVVFIVLILAIGGAMEGRDGLLFATLSIAAGGQTIGSWMLARRSRHWSEPRSPVNRFLLRSASLAMFFGSVAALWVAFDYHPAVATGASVALSLSLVAPIAAFMRIRTVARMIADAELMEHSAIVGGGFLASVIAAAVLYVFIGFRGDATGTWVTVTLFGVSIALLLFLLWGAFLMFCCILDFGQAARIAMADWKDDEPLAPPSTRSSP